MVAKGGNGTKSGKKSGNRDGEVSGTRKRVSGREDLAKRRKAFESFNESQDETFNFNDDEDLEASAGSCEPDNEYDGGDFDRDDALSDAGSESSTDHIQSVWAGVLKKRRLDFDEKLKKLKKGGLADIRDRAFALTKKLENGSIVGDKKAFSGLGSLISEMEEMLSALPESANGFLNDPRVTKATNLIKAKEKKVQESQRKLRACLAKLSKLSEVEAIQQSKTNSEVEQFSATLNDVMSQWISTGTALEDALYSSITAEPVTSQ